LSGNFTVFNGIAAKLDPFASTTIPGCYGSTGILIRGRPFFFCRDVIAVFEDETVDSRTGPLFDGMSVQSPYSQKPRAD